MIGRKEETKALKKILRKRSSSFVAITGRRRVGKTFLIDNFYKDYICFRITGIQNASQETQIINFVTKLAEFTNSKIVITPKNWQEVFLLLKQYLSSLDKRRKRVIFLDELPWIASEKSNFLQILAHLWNDYLSKENHFVLVVCGSASSWLTKNIVNDTGGLHNRLSDIIHLMPFNLAETSEYLHSLNIKLSQQEISKVYMTFGGVPFYLQQIDRGEGSASAIERICFKNDGALKNEYQNLYRALFKNADNHEAVVAALAKKTAGLTRVEIIKSSKIKPGGVYNRTIEDLLHSGFITEFIPYGKKKRGVMYRLNDEFSIFYHRFMKPNRKYTSGMFSQIAASQAYKSWTGYAFENLCFRHINQIKKVMGISAVYTEISSYRSVGNNGTKGFQIDLIIDRKDGIINLCEIKYYSGRFILDKKYALELTERRQRFIEDTKTKKQVFITFISNYGVLENEYSNEIVDTELVLDDLF